jgi:hypothetical protein
MMVVQGKKDRSEKRSFAAWEGLLTFSKGEETACKEGCAADLFGRPR